MSNNSVSHLSDYALLRDLKRLVMRDRDTTAELLAHIAEVDERKLYLPAACSSMFAYCLRELHMSEDIAFKRIRVARKARKFPRILAAVSDGRLHLSGLVLLVPYLNSRTADELLTAAGHKTRAEIERMLADRFPKPNVPTRLQALPARSTSGTPTAAPDRTTEHQESVMQLAPGPVEILTDQLAAPDSFPPPITAPLKDQTDRVPSQDQVEHRPRITPLSPQRFAFQVTIDQETHDMLQYAQELLGHSVPSGDLAEVLRRALQSLLGQLEKRKFAATDRPRRGRQSTGKRHVPAHVKRAVRERDGRQCTYIGENGQRCTFRTRLEFDHVHPVARGGTATVEGIRLRCRPHNQYEAERVFGAGFMSEKREVAIRSGNRVIPVLEPVVVRSVARVRP